MSSIFSQVTIVQRTLTWHVGIDWNKSVPYVLLSYKKIKMDSSLHNSDNITDNL